MLAFQGRQAGRARRRGGPVAVRAPARRGGAPGVQAAAPVLHPVPMPAAAAAAAAVQQRGPPRAWEGLARLGDAAEAEFDEVPDLVDGAVEVADDVQHRVGREVPPAPERHQRLAPPLLHLRGARTTPLFIQHTLEMEDRCARLSLLHGPHAA